MKETCLVIYMGWRTAWARINNREENVGDNKDKSESSVLPPSLCCFCFLFGFLQKEGGLNLKGKRVKYIWIWFGPKLHPNLPPKTAAWWIQAWFGPNIGDGSLVNGVQSVSLSNLTESNRDHTQYALGTSLDMSVMVGITILFQSLEICGYPFLHVQVMSNIINVLVCISQS